MGSQTRAEAGPRGRPTRGVVGGGPFADGHLCRVVVVAEDALPVGQVSFEYRASKIGLARRLARSAQAVGRGEDGGVVSAEDGAAAFERVLEQADGAAQV